MQDKPAATLGQVLYASLSPSQGLEREWIELVERIDAGDADALLALYDRSSSAVFTLLARLTLDRETTDELLLKVYADIRTQACQYSPADSTVLAWIMRRARAAAIERLRAEQRRNQGESVAGLIAIDMPDYRNILRFRDEEARFANAVGALASTERQAIEAAYFDGATPAGAGLRGALRKLARALNRVSPAEERAAVCEDADLLYAHALRAPPASDAERIEAHRSTCRACAAELESMRSLLREFIYWPRDVLRPPPALRERLAARIGGNSWRAAGADWIEPRWEVVAPGISCKLLAADAERQMVSMLVRLVPGGEYPAHTHAAEEELHLLHGELWIDDRKIHAGDYNRAGLGTSDKRVWSETGCTCLLVTSVRDVLA